MLGILAQTLGAGACRLLPCMGPPAATSEDVQRVGFTNNRSDYLLGAEQRGQRPRDLPRTIWEGRSWKREASRPPQ